jgi:hypothetical protein
MKRARHSLDHLIGGGEDGRPDGETERLRRRHVDAAYPVHVEIPAVEMQTTIETVEKKPLTADLFEVPADYREEPMPAPR